MTYLIIGTNHKYSPVEIREKVSFPGKRLAKAINFLSKENALKGAVVLSTCNRIEIHASTGDKEMCIGKIKTFISSFGVEEQHISRYFYKYTDKEAMRHLFLVASGLDSLILGETQILSQVRSALSESLKSGFANQLLKGVFSRAISLAKKIHTETRISKGKVSVGSVAVDFLKEKTGTLADKNILILGVGKVTELVLQYLKKERPNVIFVANRTFEKAKELAGRLGGQAVRFDCFKGHLNKTDIIISATASPHFVIKKDTLKDIGTRKILIVDLALPRDVDPSVKEMKNIELVYLEDLYDVIKKNMERKSREAERVKAIINIEAEKAWEEISELEQEPAPSL